MTEKLKYDVPLFDPDHDILGRKLFAEGIAKSIVEIKATEGFVYALYGPWGSGKSTVINFIEHYINQHNKNSASGTKIVVFRFNPWMFSGSENLTKFYLDQLQSRLGMGDVSDDLRKVSKGLSLIEHGLFFAEPLANIFMPGGGHAVKLARELISQTQGTAEAAEQVLTKDISHIKDDIITALRSQNDKILVIIDDLDRLFDNEVRDFVRMMKAVCDFPKIIYLLSCDSDKIAMALNRSGSDTSDGYDYLEKIVQCSFNIPRADHQKLHRLFFSDLDQIIEPLKNKDELFEEREWGNIFYDGIAPTLKTPRNVKSLINSIAAHYPIVRDEVNISDFVAIQTLRVFYAKPYELLENNKEYFAGPTIGKDKGDYQSFYQLLHEQVHPQNLEAFQALMGRLFPRYAQVVSSGMGYGSDWRATWRRRRKVCSEEFFDLYFSLSISNDSFSLQEMKSIIALADNIDALRARLKSLIDSDKGNNSNRFKTFLAELEDFTKEGISEERITPFLQALYDVSDGAPPDDVNRGFMDIGISMAMLRISYQLTNRLPGENDRFELLKTLFQNSTSISLLVGKAHLIDEKEKKMASQEENENEAIVNSQDAAELIATALKRIKEFANDGRLSKSARFVNTLYRWKEWGDETEVKDYIAKLTLSDEGLMDFLEGFLNVSISHGMTDKVVRRKYHVSHQDILNFIDASVLEKWIEKAKNILSKGCGLKERQKLALETFIHEKDDQS